MMRRISPSLNDYRVFLWELLSGYRYRYELRISEARDSIASKHLDYSGPLRILDLASGRLQPQYQILKARGHFVVGVDLANEPKTTLLDWSYRIVRWLYNLSVPGVVRHSNGSGLVCGDVARLPFCDNYFDLVTSVAAFEHFLDVPAVVAELFRVTRPGGVVFCGIHHFTSLSGGHNVQLMGLPIVRISKGIDPWDHLRKRRLPFHVPLNEWRIGQYKAEFSKYFEILKDYSPTREGEDLLTPELEAELSAYTREELTSGSYIIIARKPEESV